jgi:Dimerisation domain
MSDSNEALPTPPPHAQLMQMAMGQLVSRVLYAAAKLGLADELATGSKNASELAVALGAHAPSLHRLMRTLAMIGVLTEGLEHRFGLTPLGEALKTDARAGLRANYSNSHRRAFFSMYVRGHCLFSPNRQPWLR